MARDFVCQNCCLFLCPGQVHPVDGFLMRLPFVATMHAMSRSKSTLCDARILPSEWNSDITYHLKRDNLPLNGECTTRASWEFLQFGKPSFLQLSRQSQAIENQRRCMRLLSETCVPALDTSISNELRHHFLDLWGQNVVHFEILDSKVRPLTSPWEEISFTFLSSTGVKSSEWSLIRFRLRFQLWRTRLFSAYTIRWFMPFWRATWIIVL